MLVGMAVPKVMEARPEAPRTHVAASFGAMHKAGLLLPAELAAFFTELLECVEDEVRIYINICIYIYIYIYT